MKVRIYILIVTKFKELSLLISVMFNKLKLQINHNEVMSTIFTWCTIQPWARSKLYSVLEAHHHGVMINKLEQWQPTSEFYPQKVPHISILFFFLRDTSWDVMFIKLAK